MKFNIGDKVRLTREWIIAHLRWINTTEEDWLELAKRLINWFEVCYRDINLIYGDENDYRIKEEYLELMAEEGFERWEMVEVWSYEEEKRVKRFFLCEAIWAKYPYICVDIASEMKFKNWGKFQTGEWDKIRKITKLTRKEIAEKFGISESFELI